MVGGVCSRAFGLTPIRVEGIWLYSRMRQPVELDCCTVRLLVPAKAAEKCQCLVRKESARVIVHTRRNLRSYPARHHRLSADYLWLHSPDSSTRSRSRHLTSNTRSWALRWVSCSRYRRNLLGTSLQIATIHSNSRMSESL